MTTSFAVADLTKPDASSQGIAAFASSITGNELALMAAALFGEAPGWVYSQTVGSGTAERPQYEFLKNSARWFRRTNTWGSTGGNNGNLTGSVLEYSSDSGATWATVHNSARTYDSSGNQTATTGGGGFLQRMEQFFGKLLGLATSLTAHIADTTAHGAGTIAAQDADAVNIDGGSIDGVEIGASSAAEVHFSFARGKVVAKGNVAGSTPINWQAGDYFTMTVTDSAGALTWQNLPSGEAGAITLEVDNPGVASALFPAGTKYSGGVAPTRTASGKDIYECSCRDGSTVVVEQIRKDVK